jgi:phosphinothricin acetyltransferase
MPPRVRRATAADAAACVDIYRPYVLDTAITFETDVPTVQEMANRIVEALAMHEWLVLEVDGNITGYAYAHQFNSRAAYRWSVETSVYLGQDGRRAGGGRMLYAELLRGLAERGSGARSRVSRNPTRPATRCTRCSACGGGLLPACRVETRGVARRPWRLDLLGPDDEVDPPRPIAT